MRSKERNHDVRSPETLADWKRTEGADVVRIYELAGYQQRYGLGRNPALLVVDVEYGFVGTDPDDSLVEAIEKYSDSCGPGAWASLPAIARTIDLFRSRDLPIAYSHSLTSTSTGSGSRPGNAIVDELAPLESDLLVAKEGASAFFGTHLTRWLIRKRVDTIVYAGCVTSGCVRASVVDGAAYGFKNGIVEEGVFDRALVPHLVSLFDMDAKYGDVMSLQAVETYIANLEAGQPSSPEGAG